MVVDSKFLRELFEFRVVELLTVIRHKDSWNAELTYYCLPYEVLYVSLGYRG